MNQPSADLEQETINDFLSEFASHQEECERIVLALEYDGADKASIDALFRAIHTIKGNLSFVDMNSALPLFQHLEDVLTLLRNADVGYSPEWGDLVLVVLNLARTYFNNVFEHQLHLPSPEQLHQYAAAIAAIAQAQGEAQNQTLLEAISLLDPTTRLEIKPVEAPRQAHEPQPIELSIEDMLAGYDITMDEDLGFFLSLIAPLESRSRYWQGRTRRLLQLALAMNHVERSPVEPRQLAAAVFMHDVGMAFLPLETLHKASRLSASERHVINTHVSTCHDLLHRMAHWQEAAEIVLQHHEKPDGSGYPQGLEDTQICPGAKILAIADAFDAFTHERAHASLVKRPLMRAILEINNLAGSQFSSHWVDVFNTVVQKLKQHQML